MPADPQAEKTAARAPKAREMTLGDVVDRYLPFAERKLKASTYAGVVLHLRKHWQPLHAHEIQNLERRHVAAELGRIAASSGPYGANRSRAALSALFAWSIGEGLAGANPVVGTNKATDEIARNRVLSGNEAGLIWRHAGTGQYGAIVRLLLLTGQRREEVAAMQWPELDLDKGIWSLPASRTKNALPHDVPLSDVAIDLLAARGRQPRRDLVFGEGVGPFQGWSNAKSALDKRLQSAGMTAPWRLHDLRRTAATGMADLGVQPHVVEAVLNHVSGHKSGVAGIYNRAAYASEKRAALALWASHVMALRGRLMMGVSVAKPKEVQKLLARVHVHLKDAGVWGAKEWNAELARLRKLSVDHNLGLHKTDNNTFDIPSGVGQIGIPLIQVVEPRDEEALLQQEPLKLLVYSDKPKEYLLDTGFRLPRERMPALIVNLNTPDELILEAVKRELEKRINSSAPVRNPGRHALSRYFDRYTFDKWQNNRIVELAELFAWRSKLAAEKKRLYPNCVLGDWSNKDANQTNRAKKVLKDAIACLPAIFAQTCEANKR